MNNQSKQLVSNALIKVINSAPLLYQQKNYLYPQWRQRNDVSMQEFNTWLDYANQILDISYEHTRLTAVLSVKAMIYQSASQIGISNIQRIEQIKQELLKLIQIILQC